MRRIGGLALALLAGSMSVPADAAWHEVRSKHFIIDADLDAKELGDYAAKLERFDQAVRMARGMDDPPLTDAGRLRVYLLHDADELADIAKTGGVYYLGAYISRASGSYAFVARRKGEGSWDQNSDTIFFHEYAHHLMFQNWAAALPLWVAEGFAEFFSTAKIGDDGSVTLGGAANHRSVGVYAFHQDLSLSEILMGTLESLNGWQLELVYAKGWLLTHYLTFEPSRKGQLDRYLAAIQTGTPPLEAARQAFGDIGKLDSELQRYAERKEITGVVLHPDASKIGQISVRALTPAEAAIMPVRIRSDYGVMKQTASSVAGRARKVAEQFPNDAAVQASLAEAEFDADDFAAAEAAADRALSLDPQNVHALIYKGRAQMELAKRGAAKVDWTQVRSFFVKANRLDTENAEPLMLYYKSFRAAGVSPPASAVKGLYYALVLAPHDRLLRMLAVRQQLVDGNLTQAKQTLQPIAFNPHDGGSDTTANKVMAQIDAGQGANAITLIDTWEAKKK